jgi:membrane-bound serine protease (ClpP class)
MTALGIALLLVGAIVVVIEAHVPTLGILGAPGVVALTVGTVLAVAGLGGGIAVAVVAAVLVAAVGVAVVGLSVVKGTAVARRRVRSGPEGLVGRIGVVRSWGDPAGNKVLVDGALWGARRSLSADEDPPDLHAGDPVVVERMSGLTLAVRPAEDWELVL